MQSFIPRVVRVTPSLLVRSFSSSAATTINRVGVVGAGQMGTGIGFVAAVHAKKQVLLYDTNEASLTKSYNFLVSLLDKDVKKAKLTEEDKAAALARIVTSKNMEELHQTDFVIEAASENVDLKRKIFASLDSVTPAHTILATNTSSISISKIAAATKRPEKVIGMHFMNPVPVMKLVEVITALQTSDETLQTTLALADAMKKTCTKSKDVPGFIANRLLMPYINEAIIALENGIGTREDIDTTMLLGTNMPMGPLTLADFIGLDTCLAIMQVLHQGLGDSKYRPATLLQNYVDAGYLGKKVGRGFYDYSKK